MDRCSDAGEFKRENCYEGRDRPTCGVVTFHRFISSKAFSIFILQHRMLEMVHDALFSPEFSKYFLSEYRVPWVRRGGATLSRSYRINTPAPLREVAAAVATRNLLRY